MAFFSRGPNNIKDPYTMPDFYKAYMEEVEEGSGYDVSYEVFRDICEEYYKGVMDHLFEGGLYILPYNTGELSIKGKRVKKLNYITMPVDWEQTNKIGKKVFHVNDHSNYYKYRFCWSKLYRHFKNKSNYRLVFTRDNKRRLAKIIKSGDYNFFDHDLQNTTTK